MKYNNYNLLDGLFSAKTMPVVTNTGDDKKGDVRTTKRTFKIYNEHWNDFVALAAARQMTQAELLNQLIEIAVQENGDEIEQYRKFFSKK